MNSALLFGITGLALFALGTAALFVRDDNLRRILAANVAASGIFLLMISIAYGEQGGVAGPRQPTGSSSLGTTGIIEGAGFPDPVLHALVLTGIVISVSITAFALVLGGRIAEECDYRRLSQQGVGPGERLQKKGEGEGGAP